MRMPGSRLGTGVLTLAALLGLLAVGLPSADAQTRCLRRITVANGGDTAITKVRLDLTRTGGAPLRWTLGPVAAGKTRAWRPACCVVARSVTALVCLQTDGLSRRGAALAYRFPLGLRDRELLGKGSIEAIKLLVGENAEEKPSGQLVVVLSSGRTVSRSLVRAPASACDEQVETPPPPISPEDAYPFVRIRLKSKLPKEKKVLHAEARGHWGTSNTQNNVLPNHPDDGPPIPDSPYAYMVAGAHSLPFGLNKASRAELCLQLDLNEDGDTDDGEYFIGTFDPGSNGCRIEWVDFEILADAEAPNGVRVTAYVVVYDDMAAFCGSLTPPSELPNSHKLLKVKKIPLTAGDACAFTE